MDGLHPDLGIKGVIFALILEVVFLGFCGVFIGLGLSEMKKRGQYVKNSLLVLLGIVMVGVSLVVTKILIQG